MTIFDDGWRHLSSSWFRVLRRSRSFVAATTHDQREKESGEKKTQGANNSPPAPLLRSTSQTYDRYACIGVPSTSCSALAAVVHVRVFIKVMSRTKRGRPGWKGEGVGLFGVCPRASCVCLPVPWSVCMYDDGEREGAPERASSGHQQCSFTLLADEGNNKLGRNNNTGSSDACRQAVVQDTGTKVKFRPVSPPTCSLAECSSAPLSGAALSSSSRRCKTWLCGVIARGH